MNFPPAQIGHSAAPMLLYLPGGHDPHAGIPVSALNWPAGQKSQYVIPAVTWTCPTSQAVQYALDVCAPLPYCPAAHNVQVALITELQDPASHWPSHCLVRQYVCPVAFWYFPDGQLVQATSLAVAENVPAGHTAQIPLKDTLLLTGSYTDISDSPAGHTNSLRCT